MIEHLLHLLSGDLGQRVGWSLLHVLWQGAAVAAALGVALSVLHSARLRYVAACAAMVALLTLPVLTATLISPSPRTGDAQPIAASTPIAPLPTDLERTLVWDAGLTAEGPAAAVSQPRESSQPSSPWFARVDAFLPWAVLAWLTGVLVLSLWHASGWMVLRRLRRSGRPVEGALAVLFQRLIRRLGVKHAVRLLESAAVGAPAVIGFLKPVILFPASAMTGLSGAQIEAILIHELAHVRRWDGLARRIQAAAETVLFFHPAVWWVSARMTQESETCCDEIAVALCGDRQSYAQALAQVAGAWPNLAPAAGGGKLLPRLRRILGATHETRTWRALAGATAILLVTGVALIASCTKSEIEAEKPGEALATESAGEAAEADGESKTFSFYIGGDVAQPGVFTVAYGQPLTLTARVAIASTGGLAPDSEKKNLIARLYRRDEQNREIISEIDAHALITRGRFDLDVPMQDHDLLLVLDADKAGKANLNARHTITAAPNAGKPGEVYIHGKMKWPGVYSLKGMQTIKQVLLTAGFDPADTDLDTIVLTRRTGERSEDVIIIDSVKLFDGSEADRFVQPDDQLMAEPLGLVKMNREETAPGTWAVGEFAASGLRTRELCVGLFVYAADNKGTFPPDLETLVTKGILQADSLDNPNMPDRKPGYAYVRPTKAWEEYKTVATTVVLYENYDTWPADGIVVGFLDGHAEIIATEAEFKKLLDATRPADHGVIRPAALGVTQAAQPSSSDLSAETVTVVLGVHGEGETFEKAVFRFHGTDETLTDSEALYKAFKDRFDALAADPAANGSVVIEYYTARWPFIVDAYNQAVRAGFTKISFRQGYADDPQGQLFKKIAEETRQIAKLRVQEIAAQAAIELAEKEDLRNSPEVLYALDVDLEIRTLKQTKVLLETQYANLRRQFDPEHRAVRKAKEQLEFITEHLEDLQQTVTEKTIGRIKANLQAVLKSTQEQLRTTILSLEESETQLVKQERQADGNGIE